MEDPHSLFRSSSLLGSALTPTLALLLLLIFRGLLQATTGPVPGLPPSCASLSGSGASLPANLGSRVQPLSLKNVSSDPGLPCRAGMGGVEQTPMKSWGGLPSYPQLVPLRQSLWP